MEVTLAVRVLELCWVDWSTPLVVVVSNSMLGFIIIMIPHPFVMAVFEVDEKLVTEAKGAFQVKTRD